MRISRVPVRGLLIEVLNVIWKLLNMYTYRLLSDKIYKDKTKATELTEMQQNRKRSEKTKF